MFFVYVVFVAREFTHLLVGLPNHPGPRVGEGFRIELRVVNQGFDVNMIRIWPGPPFHNMQGITHWMGVLVDPDLLILKSYGVYNQRVPLPMAKLLAEKRTGPALRNASAAHRWESDDNCRPRTERQPSCYPAGSRKPYW